MYPLLQGSVRFTGLFLYLVNLPFIQTFEALFYCVLCLSIVLILYKLPLSKSKTFCHFFFLSLQS